MIYNRRFLTIVEVVSFTVHYNDIKGIVHERVISRQLRRASGIEVGSVVEGEHLAHVIFCEMKDDRLQGGKLAGEVTTLSEVKGTTVAETVEFDLDQWGKDKPEEVALAMQEAALV